MSDETLDAETIARIERVNATKTLILNLNEELNKDLVAYTKGGQRSFPISPALAASVARWPVVQEENFIVYRGQSKEYTQLPLKKDIGGRPFFSTTDFLYVANRGIFGGDGGNIFMLTLKPGVRYLPVIGGDEAEVLVEAGGVPVYADKKVMVSDSVGKRGVRPVTYYPPGSTPPGVVPTPPEVLPPPPEAPPTPPEAPPTPPEALPPPPVIAPPTPPVARQPQIQKPRRSRRLNPPPPRQGGRRTLRRRKLSRKRTSKI
jgi:hypothetical protein